MIKRIAAISVSLFVIAIVLTPIFMYFYTLNALDEMPRRSAVELSEEAVSEIWASSEVCTISDCSSITPYWVYRFLVSGVINDFINPVAVDELKSNVSKMASQIALQHIAESDSGPKSMELRHLTGLNLTIWIQRNWSAKEIVEKYRETTA